MTTLLEVGLANALVAALIAPVALVVGRMSRRPAWAHALWLLVLLKLVTPPMLRLPVAVPRGAAGSEVEVREPVAPVVAAEGPPAPIVASEAIEPKVAEAPAVASRVAPLASRVSAPGWPVLVGSAWAAGSVAWLSLALVRIARFGRALRRADEADGALADWVADLSAQIGLARPPRTVLAQARVAPMVWSLGRRATLVLPEALWRRLDAEQRAALLVHELAHLRRGDPWVRMLETIATGLYWWHPALWLARAELHRAEEQCCDLWVVWAMPKAKRTYASALVEALDFLSESRPIPMPAGASGMGQVRDLSRRIGMIMRGDAPRGLGRAGGLATIVLGAVLLPWRPGLAQQEPPPKPEAAKPEAAAKGETETRKGEGVQDDLDDQTQRLIDEYVKLAGGKTALSPLQASELTRAVDRLKWSAQMAARGYVSRSQVDADRASVAEAITRIASAGDDRARELSAAQDAAETAEGRLRTRHAAVEKAQAQRGIAAADVARIARLEKAHVVSREEIDKAKAELTIADANIQEARALEQEAEIEVRQARRRLATWKDANREGVKFPDADRPAPRDPETQKRLDDLDAKLDRIVKEIEAMRQAGAGAERPGGMGGGTRGVGRPAVSNARPRGNLLDIDSGDSITDESIVRSLYDMLLDREPTGRELDQGETLLSSFAPRGAAIDALILRIMPGIEPGKHDQCAAAVTRLYERKKIKAEQVPSIVHTLVLGHRPGRHEAEELVKALKSAASPAEGVRRIVDEAVRVRDAESGATPVPPPPSSSLRR